jgi:hypothetical protein
MMSQVLQWTQFDALIWSFLVPSPASTGLGKAMRGGQALPSAAWWMCVAVFAGLW